MTAIPSQMRAVVVRDDTADKSLEIGHVAAPTIADDEVLVKVRAFGVNRADLAQRAGHYPAPAGESSILGLEVAGDVIAVGAGVDPLWLHRAVFGLVPGGGYAEYARLHVSHLMPMSGALTYESAAASAEVFLTAYQALFHIGGLVQGGAALVHAGASGVGTAAIQLAKAAGCNIAVTVGSDDKVQACQALGADIAVNYKHGDWAGVLAAAQPTGFSVIVDPVAADYIGKDLQVLALDGRIVVLAMMGGRKVPELDLAVMFKKRGQLICSTLRNRHNAYKAELLAGFEQRFGSMLRDGTLQAQIASVLPWQQIEQAHQLLASNAIVGKIVMTIND
ncbi:MAG TPA: NADPH quinone oxidoreductase [Rheinheimera sp.]|nr:NADPH quinone oxidoreductase [Rheinheimera sp.]